jgi:hypothetical protein
MAAPEEIEMKLVLNLAAAHKLALRKAIEKDAPQALVAVPGGYAAPNADELAYECAGAEVIAVYNPAGAMPVGKIWV